MNILRSCKYRINITVWRYGQKYHTTVLISQPNGYECVRTYIRMYVCMYVNVHVRCDENVFAREIGRTIILSLELKSVPLFINCGWYGFSHPRFSLIVVAIHYFDAILEIIIIEARWTFSNDRVGNQCRFMRGIPSCGLPFKHFHFKNKHFFNSAHRGFREKFWINLFWLFFDALIKSRIIMRSFNVLPSTYVWLVG